MRRPAEIRALLDSASLLGDEMAIRPVAAVKGYRAWAEAYD
jgi:hypothetical protein